MLKETILFTLIFGSAFGKLDDTNTTVDITNGHFMNETIAYGGILFNESEYFKDNDRVKGNLVSKGLTVHKCCPKYTVYNYGIFTCVNYTGVNETQDNPIIYIQKVFRFKYEKPNCDKDKDVRIAIGDIYDIFNIGMDGKLYVETPTSVQPWTIFPPDRYCIDTFISEKDGKKISRLDALVCFKSEPEDTNYLVGIICMLISCVFIIVTVAVYSCLPELCNLHGKILIAYLLSIFVGFIFLSTMQILLSIDNITREYCLVFTFIIYYFILAAFFWLNVMCFDIWWTFSGHRGISVERMSVKSKFMAYSLYAFGTPTLFTALLAALEFSNLPLNAFLPLLRQQGCFISGTSRLLYLYTPMMILCAANLTFFILTALKIREIKQQTAVLKSRESSTHDKHNKDKQRFLLYLKLFIVMGISWVLEVISAVYEKTNPIWKVTDAYNVLVGLIIFILFVCKKKIFRLLKKRYMQLRGQSMRRSQTVSSRTVSTKEDVALASLTKQ